MYGATFVPVTELTEAHQVIESDGFLLNVRDIRREGAYVTFQPYGDSISTRNMNRARFSVRKRIAVSTPVCREG